MKPITLVTKVSIDFSEIIDKKAIIDLLEIVGSVGHDDIPFYLDWSSEKEHSVFKKYLVDTFGEDIKKYEEFILLSC
jgi:hypothetical protein